MTITIPPELAERLAAAATRYSMSPETLAIEAITLVSPAVEPGPAEAPEPIHAPPGSMLEFFAPYLVGITTDAASPPVGASDRKKAFADALVAKHLAGR